MPSVLSVTQVDHYALDSLVATSTTALIFKGTDLRTGHRVAIKIPHPEIENDPALREQFRRQQEIGGQLDHPSVVKFIVDESRSGDYLVMEWVEGQSLRRMLNDAVRLPSERAVRIGAGICDALEYVHAQDVVHRDLKPENIMVDAEDRVKVLDFGIAGMGEVPEVMGTPDYISPEQVQGKRADARSDLYAMGVMLYEMLTGEVPFRGDTPLAVMNSRLINDPIPPREADPGVSTQLQEVLYRALERDPRHRYASAHEFSWDLRHLDQVGVTDRGEIRNWRHQRKPWRRIALHYGALAGALALMVVLLFYVARHG